MKHTKELIDKVIQYRRKGYTIATIKNKIDDEYGINISTETIHRNIAQQKINELSDDLPENSYEYNDEELFVWTFKYNADGDRVKVKHSIPFMILNEIQLSYIGQGKNYTQQKIINTNRGNDNSPLYLNEKVWNKLKSVLGLNKQSGITNDIYLKILRDKFGLEAVDEYIEDTALKVIKDGFKGKQIKALDRVRGKYIDTAVRHYGDTLLLKKTLRSAIENYKPKTIKFTKPKVFNNKTRFIVISDIHYGRTTDVVKKNLGKILEDIRDCKEDNIVVLNLGDNTESCIPQGMFSSQPLIMDVLGFQQLLGVVSLFEDFIIDIHKMGKNVSVKGLTQSNHDRFGGFKDDPERIIGYAMFELLKKGLSHLGDIVEYYTKPVGSFEHGKIKFILHHGDKKFNNTKSLTILGIHGSQGYHNVICSGHWHDAYLESGTGYTRIRVESPNAPDDYALYDFLAKNEPGYASILPNDTGSVNVIFNRL